MCFSLSFETRSFRRTSRWLGEYVNVVIQGCTFSLGDFNKLSLIDNYRFLAVWRVTSICSLKRSYGLLKTFSGRADNYDHIKKPMDGSYANLVSFYEHNAFFWVSYMPKLIHSRFPHTVFSV